MNILVDFFRRIKLLLRRSSRLIWWMKCQKLIGKFMKRRRSQICSSNCGKGAIQPWRRPDTPIVTNNVWWRFLFIFALINNLSYNFDSDTSTYRRFSRTAKEIRRCNETIHARSSCSFPARTQINRCHIGAARGPNWTSQPRTAAAEERIDVRMIKGIIIHIVNILYIVFIPHFPFILFVKDTFVSVAFYYVMINYFPCKNIH